MKARNVLAALVVASAPFIASGALTGTSHAAPAPCRDSNGAAPGGSVYFKYTTRYFGCDVSPPQRLHITGTPSARACADMGGHGWTASTRICWDVDY